jgi:hypothetical protein
MIAFIDDHRRAYGVEPICAVLPIAPSTYHSHAARRANPSLLPARAKRDAKGQAVARCTVGRLMRTVQLLHDRCELPLVVRPPVMTMTEL